MIDANYLGKVNYFPGKMIAGDRYMKVIYDAVKAHVRDSDLIYRYGGDEFFLQLDRVSPKEAQEIAERISKAVSESSEANQIFNAQRTALAQRYQAVSKAQEFSQLPTDMIQGMKPEAREIAQADFGKFKTDFLAAQKKSIETMAKMHPSISVGSTMVKSSDTVETVVDRTSQQVGIVKGEYKQGMGIDTEGKYGAGSVPTSQSGPKPKAPEVLLPDDRLSQ